MVFNIIDLYTAGPNGEYCSISVGYETDIQNGYKFKERSGRGSYLDEEDPFLKISAIENPDYHDFFKMIQDDQGAYQEGDLKVEYHRNYMHNGVNYKYVIIGSKDTINNSPKISRIIRAIPGGILGFYDFETKLGISKLITPIF